MRTSLLVNIVVVAAVGLTSSRASAQTTRLSDNDVVIERGDTLTWVRHKSVAVAGRSRIDTVVVRFKGDSVFMLRPRPKTRNAMPEVLANTFLIIRRDARLQRQLNGSLSHTADRARKTD